MALHVETLTGTSSDADIQKAISESISQCVAEGKTQEQCVAISHEIANRKSGRSSGNGGERRIRAALEQ